MRLTPHRYRMVTIGALVALCVIVVSGAAVRLTGSGLGCDDWPNCNDQQLIDVSSGHAAIEQVNRLFTGLVAIAVIAAVLGSLVRVPRRRDLTWLSWGLVAGVVAQIVLGGITVLVDLHPVAVQGHLVLSMVLVANAVVLVRRAGEPDGGRRLPTLSRSVARHVQVAVALTGIGILTGTLVTGAGPHAGDEDARRFDLDISSVARIHSLSVLAAITAVVVLAARVWERPDQRRPLEQLLPTWVFLGALQAVIGYVQYFNEVPAMLVGAHVAAATALWVATVFLALATSAVAAETRRGGPELVDGAADHVGHRGDAVDAPGDLAAQRD